MAGEESVAGIGVGLDIDISGWTAGIEKAKAQLDGLTKGAQGATIAVPLGGRQAAQGGRGGPAVPPLAVSAHLGVSRGAVSAMRVQANQHLRTMAQGGQAVQVPISLGRVPYGQMRSQIAHGIGEVPVRIRLDPVGVQGIRSVLTAVLTQTAAGARSPAALAQATDVRIPHREAGGPVAANRPVWVGERGVEVYWPRSAGQIIPHAGGGIRVADRMSKGQLDFVGNLRAAASRIRPHQAAGGLSWYTDAGAYARRTADQFGMKDYKKAIGILAALSAGTSWTSNQTKFENILSDAQQKRPFRYSVGGEQDTIRAAHHQMDLWSHMSATTKRSMGLDAHRKALGILTGTLTPEEAFKTSPKVGQFDKGIGGDLSALVLDRWATRTTTRGVLDQPPKSMRPAMEHAWKKVAKEHGWSNAQFQAALWLLEKEEAGQSPGQVPMELRRGGFVHAKAGLFAKADPETFASAIAAARTVDRHGRTVGETVAQYPVNEYAKMRTYLAKDRASGYAVKPDGDLVSVFNVGRPGMGKAAIRSAIQRGASKLDAFDEVGTAFAIGKTHPNDLQKNLPKFYGRFGFRETGRDPWNPDYAPSEWRGGTPDVVYMQRLGKKIRGEQRQRGGHVQRRNPKVDRQTLYALRWPNQAQNRHYDDVAEAERWDRYRPDDMRAELGDDREYGHGSPLGEGRLWQGGIPHRWQGGVARIAKDRLPKGFRFAFTTDQPGLVGETYEPVGTEHREIQNPIRSSGALISYLNQHGGRSRPVASFAVNVINERGKLVATAPWGYEQESVRGEGRRRGYLHPHMTKVAEEMQGKGLATAMYMASEAFSGVSTKPSNSQLAGGKGLWAQPNRPFGKRYGDLPGTGGAPAYYNSKFDLERTKKTNKKRTALGLPPSETSFLETMVRRSDQEAATREPVSDRPGHRPIHERMNAVARAREAQIAREADEMVRVRAKNDREAAGHIWINGRLATLSAPYPHIAGPVRGQTSDVGGRMGETLYSNSGVVPGFGGQFGNRAQRMSMATVRSNRDNWAHGPSGKQQILGLAGGGSVSALQRLFPNADIELGRFSKRDLAAILEAAGPLAERYPLTSENMRAIAFDPSTERSRSSSLIARLRSSPFDTMPGAQLKGASYGHRMLFQNRAARIGPELHTALEHQMVDPSIAGTFRHEFAHAVDYTHGTQPRYGASQFNLGLLSKYAGKGSLPEGFAELFGAVEGHRPAAAPFLRDFKPNLDRISELEKKAMRLGKIEASWRSGRPESFAEGGSSTKGLYIVNEIGREKYVPKHLEHLIPPDVARQIPGGEGLAQRLAMRRYSEMAAGSETYHSGILDINGPEQLWKAPGDGWIIPNRLIGRIPHAEKGRPIVTQDASGQYTNPETGREISPRWAHVLQQRVAASGNAVASPVGMRGEDPTSKLLATLNKSSLAADQFSKAALSVRVSAANDPERLERARQHEIMTAERTAERGLQAKGNVGGLFISALGGKQRAEARAEYTRTSKAYELLSPVGTDAVEHFTEKLDESRHSQTLAEHGYEQLSNTVGVTKRQLGVANQAVLKWGDNVRDSARELQGAGELRDQRDAALQRTKGGALSQFGAIQFAGISYQIGMQVAGFLAGAATDVMKPFVDTITGFGAVTTRVTAALAQELPQNGGQLGVTFAKAGVSAGLSGQATSYLQGILGNSVNAKAASTAQGQASDLFRAAAGVGNAPSGLTGGYGGLFGTALFAQQLGGGKGYEEQIAGDVAAIGGPTSAPTTQGVQGSMFGGGEAFNFGALASSGLNGIYNPQAGYSNVKGASGQSPLGVVTNEIQSTTEAAGRYQKMIGSATNVELKFFDTGQKGLDEQAKAWAVAGDAGDTYAQKLANQGIGWFVNGQVAGSAQQLTAAQQQAANGVNIPDQQAIVASLQPQIKAQVAQTAASTAFAVGGPGSGAGQSGLIGGAFGLQLAANPFTAAQQGGAGSGVALNFQSKLAPQIKAVSDLQAQLSAQATQGITDMTAVVNQNMGPQAAAQFTGYVQDVAKYGTEITAITSTLANKQAAVGALQYGNSLRIINRSIKDAQGLVTGQGATSGGGANLGAVQRLQFTLQQQSEQLGIAQSQRQINFAVASAGFQAPGQTSEQRAANIAEAKYEASIAQKQLNIQKQQVPLAKTAFDVGAVRSLVDLQAQRAINAQEYALSQEQVVAQKRVNALQMAMALSQQRAQKILDGAVGNWNSALSMAAQAAAQYGYDLGSILGDIRKGIDQALGLPVPGGSTGYKTKGVGANKASGAIFNTTGATSLTMGEAGTEHVAILRNPRSMALGAPSGGGGSVTVQVNVSGNTVRSDADIDTLVRRTADAVERMFNTRGAMLGLRSLGG